MSLYQIKPLDRSHNEKMLEILHSAPIITDGLTICFDRQPDIFRMAEIKYAPYHYFGFFREDMLVGFALNGYHTALVNGKPETVCHFTDYYVAPKARGMGFGYKMSKYFFKGIQDAKYGYGVIMEGNNAALSYIGRRHPRYPNLPWSRIINQLEVKIIMLTWPINSSVKYKIRFARAEDIPEMVTLLNEEHKDRLFGMIFSEQTFENYIARRLGITISNYYLAEDRYGRICGVCAAWDCSSFKQNRVLDYGKRFLPTRIGYKGLSILFNLPSLPKKGDLFKDITITDYAVKNRDQGVMNALLRAIYADYRKAGYHSMIWGSSSDDPMLQASKGFFSQSVISKIILCGTRPELIEDGAVNNYLPYIDVACL